MQLRTRWMIMLALGLTAAACGDDDGGADATVETDAGDDATTGDAGDDAMVAPDISDDAFTTGDAGDDGAVDAGDDAMADAGDDAGTPAASAQIQEARDAADGVVDVLIEGAIVSYVRPSVPLPGDPLPEPIPAGFFIQADMTGPALAINVDPATLDPAPVVGDTITIRITEMTADGGDTRTATMVTDYARTAQGFDVSTLVQDLSAAADIVSGLDGYESELVQVTGTLTAGFDFAGGGHQAAVLDTAGLADSSDLRVRMPDAMADALDADEVGVGCALTFSGPMWRFHGVAQPSVYFDADLMVDSCPAPVVEGAMSTGTSSVVLTFDRSIDETSLMGDGSQFTFDSGLTASAAVLTTATTITVTTSDQDPDTNYTATVAASLTDLVGGGIDAAMNTAMFMGFPVGLEITAVDFDVISRRAQLVINGSNFTGATAVTIGGTTQAFVVDSDAQITIAAVDATTPLIMQDVVVTAPMGSAMYGVTVIDLLINEVDYDQSGSDTAEFLEVSVGFSSPAVDLSGYSMVAYNGNNGLAYRVQEFAGMTAMGLLTVGETPMMPTIVAVGGDLQNGGSKPDGVAIYQGVPASAADITTTSPGLLDAVVYERDPGEAGDTALDDLGITPDKLIDTGDGSAVVRCGTVFMILGETPNAPNTTCP